MSVSTCPNSKSGSLNEKKSRPVHLYCVMPELLVFHHANVRTVSVEIKKSKSFLSRGKARFTARKQQGNLTLINGSWSLWCVCVVCTHVCVAVQWKSVSSVKERKFHVQHLWAFLCVCVFLFDWHLLLSGRVCSDLNSLALDPSYARAVKQQKSVKSGTVFP